MTTAYLLTPTDPYDECTLVHPDGTRETVAQIDTARPLGISLAVRGFLTPWPLMPAARYPLDLLPETPCPEWCPGTATAHRIEADDLARIYLEHSLYVSAGPEASVAVRQFEGWHPRRIGEPVLAVLGDDLDHTDALALAATITAAAAHLPERTDAPAVLVTQDSRS